MCIVGLTLGEFQKNMGNCLNKYEEIEEIAWKE